MTLKILKKATLKSLGKHSNTCETFAIAPQLNTVITWGTQYNIQFTRRPIPFMILQKKKVLSYRAESKRGHSESIITPCRYLLDGPSCTR